MSCSTGAACVVQTCAFTAVDAYLTAGATSSFFVCVSQPYAVFALDDADLTLVGGSLNATTGATATATIDRRGDKLSSIWATFSAKGLMNCSTLACTLGGRTGSADQSDTGTSLIRGIIGGCGPKEWVQVQMPSLVGFQSNANLGPGANIATITLAANQGQQLRSGDRVHIRAAGSNSHSTLIDSIAGDVITLSQSFTNVANGIAYITVEREINRGLKDCGESHFISEQSDIMGFSHTSTDGSDPDTVGNKGMYYRDAGGDPRDLAAYYVAFAPCVLIESASLLSGSQCLDSIGTSMLIIYQEMFVGASKVGRRSVNGSRDKNQLKRWALQDNEWQILLPFQMSTSYCKALSLVSICLHNLKLQLKYRGVANAVANGSNGMFTDYAIAGNNVLGSSAGANAVVNTRALRTENSITPAFNAAGTLNDAAMPSNNFAATDIVPGVRVRFVYSGKMEREQEVNLSEKIVVVEHQELTNNLTTTSGGALTTQLGFSHPIMALFVTSVSNFHSKRGDLFNFDGHPAPLTYNATAPRQHHLSPFKTCTLRFNSGSRTGAMKPNYWMEIQPGAVAEPAFTGTNILSYFFCVGNPYSHQVSGSANFARLDRVEFVATPQAWVVANQSNAGAHNGSSTSAGTGSVSGGNLLNITFSVISVNVWTTDNCMLGRFFA